MLKVCSILDIQLVTTVEYGNITSILSSMDEEGSNGLNIGVIIWVSVVSDVIFGVATDVLLQSLQEETETW